ncbi:MAG: DUF2325 domain-containing protein [Arcobacteraceae bacterium]|nr:DUF2325 domain-containing protein [Arcobacteraceae bacterium]
MSVLVIGGDQIDAITTSLNEIGVNDITHWTLRSNRDMGRKIPQKTEYIIMLTNFLSHNAMYKFKTEAKKRNIPFVCANRNENSVICKFCELANICPNKK